MTDPETHSDYESLWMRLISMIIIGVLLSFAQSLFWIIAVIQFIIMPVSYTHLTLPTNREV